MSDKFTPVLEALPDTLSRLEVMQLLCIILNAYVPDHHVQVIVVAKMSEALALNAAAREATAAVFKSARKGAAE